MKVRDDRFRRVHGVGEVRPFVDVEQRRDAYCDDVACLQLRKIGGRGQSSFADRPLQVGVDDVADVVLSFVDFVDFVGLDVETGDGKPCLGLFDRERQSDEAEADACGSVPNFIYEFLSHVAHLFCRRMSVAL